MLFLVGRCGIRKPRGRVNENKLVAETCVSSMRRPPVAEGISLFVSLNPVLTTLSQTLVRLRT